MQGDEGRTGIEAESRLDQRVLEALGFSSVAGDRCVQKVHQPAGIDHRSASPPVRMSGATVRTPESRALLYSNQFLRRQPYAFDLLRTSIRTNH